MCVVVAKAARVGGEKLVQLKIVVGGDCGRLCNFFLQFANCLQFSVKAGKAGGKKVGGRQKGNAALEVGAPPPALLHK